ncbi:MAG: DUF2726 domain-containing protein [Pseudomonadota bacterium]|nr:DUF2726 domain-containing protein [Pseudomonadota bacterium]
MFYATARRQRLARLQPKRVLPRQWPLNPRPLANTEERQVWHWLHQTFPEYHVLPKLPLTRFTMPRDPSQGSEWFSLLSGAYCSFTLCDDEAHVLGCVDVLGSRGLPRDNRIMKQSLLSQCGIGYWVVSPDDLPDPKTIRTDFLGLNSTETRSAITDQAHLESVRQRLHEALDRNRSQRHYPVSGDARDPDADITPWPQPDSFLGALDPITKKLK